MRKILVILTLLCAPSALRPAWAFAQDKATSGQDTSVATPENQLVKASEADPQSPPLIPSNIFAIDSAIGAPKLSADGAWLSFFVKQDKRQYIAISEPYGGVKRTILLPEDFALNWYRWIDNDRMLIGLSSVTTVFGIVVPYSKMLLYDMSTQKGELLQRKKQGLNGDDLLYLDRSGKYALVSMARDIFSDPGVYRVSLKENEWTKIVNPRKGINEWLTDDNGVVRMGIAYRGRTTKFYYRKTNEDKFKLVSKIKQKASEDETDNAIYDLTRIVSGSDDGYVLSNKQTGRLALYRFNYLTRETGELLLDHPKNDITGFVLSDDGTELESARYTDERDRMTWFKPDLQKRQDALEKALQGQEAWILSRSQDEKRMIVFSVSSIDPGSYYLYEPDANRLHRLAGVNDKIDPAHMAPAKYVSYKARDGLEIPAYLTLPKGRSPKGLPLVIMPHGGPYSVRDLPDYDGEVQFLANRGYAVLRPNFRGSDSYGEEFYKKGEGQIGRKMQDDLDDGMDWLVKEGIVDPARICLVGGSYGGYAALWGVIRNPERYRCAASFAGVTDYKAQMKYDFKSISSRYRKDWRSTLQGAEEFDLDNVSPAKQAASVKRPILLTHGDKDGRVPFSQFENFLEAAEQAGTESYVESYVYEGEGHGFSDVANEKDWLDRLEAFLIKHNPADATTTPEG